MCGIFGYVGTNKETPNVILSGLKILEYRGYDSWGIAVRNNSKISIEKHTGKINKSKVNLPKSNIGIGHTRWATHGGVTSVNAHPHLDCSGGIAVIHNGIVENYQILKAQLTRKGHKFVSETDTEVIPHLIEEALGNKGFASAVRYAFNKLEGMNAIVVMNSVSSEIVAAKSGSPMVIGKSDDGFYVSSDAVGLTDHTKNLMFLRDGEMVIMGKKLQLINLKNGKKIPVRFETVDWNLTNTTKGKYKYFMEKEIREQPQVIKNIANNFDENAVKIAKLIKNAYGTFFIGAGSAYYATIFGSYLFSKVAKKHVNTMPASEFNYLEDFLTQKSLIIALSQSGETIDIVEPLNRAKLKKSKIVALTNVLGSTIYRMADYKFLLAAGPEKAVASTKAFIAKISILTLIAFALNNNLRRGKKILEEASREAGKYLNKSSVDNIKKLASLFSSNDNMYLIGRGISYSSAMEGAMKIKEVSYIHAEGWPGGELKHGSIALISQGSPTIVFAPNDETYSAVMSNAMEIKSRGGYIIGVSFKNDPIFDYFIETSEKAEVSYITQIIPIQLLAYFLALKNNLDPDKPRNLAKSVTVR